MNWFMYIFVAAIVMVTAICLWAMKAQIAKWYARNFGKFNTLLLILEERQGSLYLKIDRGRRVTSPEKMESYQTLNSGVIKPPGLDCLLTTSFGKVGSAMLLYTPDTQNYYPVKLNRDSAKDLIIMNQDQKQFYTSQVDEAYSKYKTLDRWSQVLPLAIPFILCLGIGLLLYIAIPVVTAPTGVAAEQIAKAMDVQNNLIRVLIQANGMDSGMMGNLTW